MARGRARSPQWQTGEVSVPDIVPARRAVTTSDVVDRLEVLFAEQVESVFNVAYRVLWNRADAEDVVQRTFLKALTRLDQLRDPGRVRPWLLQVAYREAIAVVRARREVPTAPEDMPESEVAGAGPAEAAVLSDVARTLSEALGKMNESERVAVVLRDVEQLPTREVAEVLGVGISAAKMRIHRGRASLRELLAGKEVW